MNPQAPIEMSPEMLAELARQEPLIRALSEKLTNLMAKEEPPVIASALLDMLLTLGAGVPDARPSLTLRLRKLAWMLGAMPAGVPTQAQLERFLDEVNAQMGHVKPPQDDKPNLILPAGMSSH